MLCNCEDQEDKENIRDRHLYKEAPIKIKIVNALGLKKYLIDNFVFRKPKPRYKIESINDKKEIFINGKKYNPPSGYVHTVEIVQNGIHKIPVVRLSLIEKPEQKPVLIYSHGNSSDLSHSLQFMHKFSEVFQINSVVYDYTGYGISHQNQVSQKSICEDLKKIIEWTQRSLTEIILWGFSLGCHPTISAAASLNLNGIILQSPFASILSFFQQQVCHQKLFKGDCFSNISLIQFIKCRILLIHSKDDDLIPFKHSQALYERYNLKSKQNKIQFIQVEELNHNQMHCYFYAKDHFNKLQLQLSLFLKKAQKENKADSFQVSRTNQSEQQDILEQQCIKISQITNKTNFFSKKLRYFDIKQGLVQNI